MGWAGLKNGELLRRAADQFDIFLTVDRNLQYQQSFPALSLAVIIVHAPSNDIAVLRPLIPAVLGEIPRVKAGAITHIRR
jgi:hypothetical protein